MSEDLVFSLFSKDITEITRDDVIKFFETERSETDKLEFKSYIDQQIPGTVKDARDVEKITEIIITICGFLNSDGGILIWGAPKGKRRIGGRERIYKGDLRPVGFLIEQEQFISKVSMQISPTPLRIKYKSLEIDPDKFIYIIHVSKSDYAPHQYKGTYYMRLDGSTVTAPHHYVEALMKKNNLS